MISSSKTLAFVLTASSVYLSLCGAIPVAQSSPISITAKLLSPTSIGGNDIQITVIGPDAKPVLGAKITLTVGMRNMDMGTTHPPVTELGNGVYSSRLLFGMGGTWSVSAKIEATGMLPTTKNFQFEPKGAGTMPVGSMEGKLGNWSMAKEGSGTSWLPESSPMFMDMLPASGRYDLSLMGFINFDNSYSGGLRGTERSYSNSMMMLMGRRETGGGVIGTNLMISLDPVFNGEYGYPDLFQTGETAYGQKLVDYQHPHNLLSEVTGSYSHPIGNGVSGFLYGGPIGEPALGGPAFGHRPSGFEIPEAPISHHWFDSTHISFGVVTAGINTNQWQVECSVFNGHEPGENRYIPGPFALNSASTRLTYNPTKNLSLNTSYGFLDSPESTALGIDQHRTTAALIWSLPLRNGDNLSITGYVGSRLSEGTTSNAYLLEGTFLTGPTSIFVRWENVNEDELTGVSPGSYVVNKVLFGGIRNFMKKGGMEFGVGAYAGLYSYPSSLDTYYGHGPVTLGAFIRLRPARMKM